MGPRDGNQYDSSRQSQPGRSPGRSRYPHTTMITTLTLTCKAEAEHSQGRMHTHTHTGAAPSSKHLPVGQLAGLSVVGGCSCLWKRKRGLCLQSSSQFLRTIQI